MRPRGRPHVSALMRNRAGNFSVGRLMKFLTALGQDVRITVKPTRKEQGRWKWWWGEGLNPPHPEEASHGKIIATYRKEMHSARAESRNYFTSDRPP